VIARVNAALASGSAAQINALAEELDRYNNYGSDIDQHGMATGVRMFFPAETTAPAALPTLSVSDATIVEGAKGATALATMTVSLSQASTVPVTVTFTVVGGSGTRGSDYTGPTVVTLTFAPGQTTATVTFTIIGDRSKEANETVLVQLSNASGATIGDGQGTLTIVNDD
jgi:hypothetical protein